MWPVLLDGRLMREGLLIDGISFLKFGFVHRFIFVFEFMAKSGGDNSTRSGLFALFVGLVDEFSELGFEGGKFVT